MLFLFEFMDTLFFGMLAFVAVQSCCFLCEPNLSILVHIEIK